MIYSRIRTQSQYVVLPPSNTVVSDIFQNVEYDSNWHGQLIGQMQRFRGSVYAADGAVQSRDLTADGRHKSAIDDFSWHVLALDENNQIRACLRYFEEGDAETFDDLYVRKAAFARAPRIGNKFRAAVEAEMERARQSGLGFGEVGGWAVSEECRWTSESLRIVFAIVALLELLGGRIGLATATARHCSSTILRRIGLHPLHHEGAELPPYYDPQYSCDMQVLRFDSRFPNTKYREWIDNMAVCLSAAPVVCSGVASVMPRVFRGFDASIQGAALAPVA